MASDRSTQDDLLDQILRRLQAKIPDCTELTCYLCDQSTPASWPAGSLAVVLSVRDGRFPEAFHAGGGVLTLCEQMTLEVTVWVRCQLDSPPGADVALLNPDLGLISRYKPAVLRALLLEEDANGNAGAWMPVDPGGIGLLRNQLAPLACTAARPDADGQWLGMTITFAVDFDWRL